MSHVCLQCGLAFDQQCHLQQHLPLCSTNTQKFKVSQTLLTKKMKFENGRR